MDELNRQKNGTTKHAEDVRETLQWLDDATDKHPGSVAVQGPEDTYEKWDLVERFVVPRTLFSEDNHEHELELIESNGNSYKAATKLLIPEETAKASFSSGATEASGSLSPSSMHSPHSSTSALSPPTSPTVMPEAKSIAALNAAASRPQSSSASVPAGLQPLFNYILWRIHQELDPVAALESFIFLCNDGRKVGFAKGFDIKTKRLEQLREAVGREDRDFKNRQALLNRENQNVDPEQGSAKKPVEVKKVDRPITPKDAVGEDEDEEDNEVVFKPHPPRAPAAMLQKSQPNLIDPNAFGRGPQPQPQPSLKQDLPKAPQSPRIGNAPAQRGSPLNRNADVFTPRGNARGGRGNVRGNNVNFPGRGNFNGRGNFTGHTAVTSSNANQLQNVAPPSPHGQIDPASFARPEAPRQQRKLWTPT